jgi:adenine/guanine phosphoribosyltransferase-like PRPP-binding protein
MGDPPPVVTVPVALPIALSIGVPLVPVRRSRRRRTVFD